MMLAMSVMTLILWILHEWMEQMNIPWMNGTNEYSVNEWNEWIFREWMEQMNIPWMNGANEYSLNEWNEWIFPEWMERMNIPWMNGTNEYSVNEWNEWIFREWIFLVPGGPCQVQTENVLRLLLWALWISSQFFASHSFSLSLSGLCTQQPEIANSVDGGENQ